MQTSKSFVVRVLSGHELSFRDKFLIRFPKLLNKASYSDIVRTWISSRTKFSLQVLSMEDFIASKDLLAWIFTCESIETMFLTTTYYRLGYSQVINLPCIRRLQLKHIRLDKRSITTLYSGCPVLEELSLDSCSGEFSSIFSKKLKYLSISGCKLEPMQHCKITMFVKSSVLGDTVESVFNIFFPFSVPGTILLETFQCTWSE